MGIRLSQLPTELKLKLKLSLVYCFLLFKLVRGDRVAGWVAGWLDQLEIRLNSASVEIEVEVEA